MPDSDELLGQNEVDVRNEARRSRTYSPWATPNDPRIVDNGRNEREGGEAHEETEAVAVDPGSRELGMDSDRARGGAGSDRVDRRELVGRSLEDLPGAGRAPLEELLKAGCPKCGGALRAETAFSTLIELVLLRIAPLTADEEEQLGRTVELHCFECGYVGAAQRPAREEER